MKKNAIATASLADYAAVANDEVRAADRLADQAKESAWEGLVHAKNAGLVLLKAKSALRHGEWLPWLEANFEASPRKAQDCMRLAQNWAQLEGNGGAPLVLTIEAALKALPKRAKTDPEPSGQAKPELSNTQTPAYLPAAPEPQPEPQKPAKPAKPAEVEKIQAELEEANSTIRELASQQQPLQDEVEFLRKIETEGDKLAAACAEVKRLQAVVRGQEERIRGLMNEKNEAVRAAKMWKAKFEKAARAAA